MRHAVFKVRSPSVAPLLVWHHRTLALRATHILPTTKQCVAHINWRPTTGSPNFALIHDAEDCVDAAPCQRHQFQMSLVPEQIKAANWRPVEDSNL